MRIGIDARWYGPEHGGGGIGRYVEELVTHLAKLPSDHEFVLFFHKENFDLFTPPNARWSKQVVQAHWYTLREQWEMPRAYSEAKLDLVHVPHFNVPLTTRTPFVATVHDLILFEVPESARATHLGPVRYAVKRFGVTATFRHVAKNARAIIVPSKYTEQSLVAHFPRATGKTRVIYEGVRGFSSGAFGARPNRPTFLYVGSSYPHKNLHRLLQAFALVKLTLPDAALRIAGKKDVWMEELEADSKRMGLDTSFLGQLNDVALRREYANATAFVFPSLVEGFGLPPLEAMSMGTPVIASSTSCLPEILGDAALYADPLDPQAIAKQMIAVATDDELRRTMIARGAERIKNYSWEQAAKETLAVYEKSG